MKILLIGCGNMGGAMLAGWLASPQVQKVDVVDPSLPAHGDQRVQVHRDIPASPQADIAVLAVKPRIMDGVAAALGRTLPGAVPVLSIAAGVTLARLAKHLGTERPLVRAMPNTPGAIGQGITGYIQNNNMNEKQLDTAVFLIKTLGNCVHVKDEAMMDALTALSGSGPAYIYAFTESLEKAGIKAGLSPEASSELARQTVIGAAALMAAEPARSPADLRIAVTSPGGTTAAALDILQGNHRLDTLVEEAVLAATKRSRDLA